MLRRGETVPRRISEGPPLEVADPDLAVRRTVLAVAHRLRAVSPGAADPVAAARALLAWTQEGRSPIERQVRLVACDLVAEYRLRHDFTVDGFIATAAELVPFLAGIDGGLS